MGRSVKKGPFIDSKLLKKVLKQRDTGDKQPIRTWSRSCIIIPEFVSHTFMVHNGKIFHKLFYYGRYGRAQTWRICSYENI